MGQRGDEWRLSGEAVEARAPSGMPVGPFPLPALPVDPIANVPWGEITNPALASVSILLPALNEEDGVADVLNRIPRLTLQQKGYAYSVHLLDGGSTDRTRVVAKKLGAEIFVQSGNGKGSAFREFVPKIRGQFAVLLDSDGTYPPEIIPELVGKLGPETPVVLGSRLRGSIGVGAMSMANRVGNRMLSWFASFLFGTPISDVCSGMWGFDSNRLKSLDLTAIGFELEADLFAECALKGIPITEVPIRYDRRIGEKKLHLREGLRIALALLKKRLGSGAAPSKRKPRFSIARLFAEQTDR
ncbi:MAG TPA: glycosyltransferase family 2 protein [Thermoplasmata archaeon]|nr:glycosyltransferase family 2 protein [Thermoplasmata archaeon]